MSKTKQTILKKNQQPGTQADKKNVGLSKLRGIKLVDRLFFVQNLEIMLRTGFSLSEALKLLGGQIKNRYFQSVVLEIQQSVERGQSLSESMRNYKKVFSEIFVNMIEAGEVSGQLENTLKQLTVQLKKSYTLKKKITNALIYPCIILAAMMVVGTGMVIFVLPKILSLYETGSFDIPITTRILISISKFLSSNLLFLAAGIIILLILFIMLQRTEQGKRSWHTFVLHLPIASRIIIQIQLAKFFRILHSLLSTDIPIVKSFQIIAQTMRIIPYREIVTEASERLKRGVRVHESLDQNPKLFTPITLQMMRIGEESGSLEEISEEIAQFFETEVDNTMNNLTVIIEPVLMLILGAGVAFIAVAVIMPIYSLVNQV